jgi:hypothetical protein
MFVEMVHSLVRRKGSLQQKVTVVLGWVVTRPRDVQ